MRANPRVRLVAGLALLLAVLGAGLAYLAIASSAPATASNVSATLTIFVGSVQVRKAGANSFAIARTGDRLAAGDSLRTAADTRAALDFPDRSLIRVASSTALAVTRLSRVDSGASIELRQDAGKSWSQVNGAGPYAVRGPQGAMAAASGPAEFSFVIEVRNGHASVNVDTLRGSVQVTRATVRPSPEDPWTVYNTAADQRPPGATAAAEAQGTINPGETTPLEGAVTNARPADIRLTLSWPGSLLELQVYREGRPFESVASSSPPLNVDLDGAGAAAWSFRIHDIDSGPDEPWIVITSVVSPAQKPAVPFFVPGGPCAHEVVAGGSDTWTVAARDAAGPPLIAAVGLVYFSRFADAGDGTASVTFEPPPTAAEQDVELIFTASLQGRRARLGCVEHVRASGLTAVFGK